MNDVLGPHNYQAREMEEFERKEHDSIPIKVKTVAAIIKKSSSQSIGLTYSIDLVYI